MNEQKQQALDEIAKVYDQRDELFQIVKEFYSAMLVNSKRGNIKCYNGHAETPEAFEEAIGKFNEKAHGVMNR